MGWMEAQGDRLGLITTNYDISVEYDLYESIGRDRVAGCVDLGFAWRDAETGARHGRPRRPQLRVYKLHGSLDQLRCARCGNVYLNPWGVIAWQAMRVERDDDNTCHCGGRLVLNLVPPSLLQETHDPHLVGVSRRAFEWLRSAERWIIIGYSLPPEDLAVRSLLLRAHAAAPRRPEVIVVQRGHAVRARFQLMFPACTYLTGGLEAFLSKEGEVNSARESRK